MVRITPRLQNAAILLQGIASAERTILDEQDKAIVRGLRLIRDEAKRIVRKDRGDLQRSIRETPPLLGQGQVLHGRVGPTVVYGGPVEYGRTAGARWPPFQPIQRWGRRHGFTTERQIYFLRRKIGLRGIKEAPFMRSAYERTKEQVLALMQQANIRAVQAIARGGRL